MYGFPSVDNDHGMGGVGGGGGFVYMNKVWKTQSIK